MSRPRNRAYKRTWKNLLLNKRLQLRFTLFMVVLSAVMMGLLGWWVMTVAARATTVAVNNTLTACQGLPGAPVAQAPSREPVPAPPDPEPRPDVDQSGDDGGRERARPVVTIDDSGMKDLPPAAPVVPAAPAGPSAGEIAQYQKCQGAVPGKVRRLEERQRLIFWVLVGAGVILALGLLAFGIKMTHRVAGPLYKVTLYMAKLRDGLYDTVYNLRKGDQLIGFYEHFKAAHAGMRGLQDEDLVRLRALLAEVDAAGLAGRSPELDAAIADLRNMLDRKETSLV